jgi:nucleotide-binding universal stress UspA family protein
LRALAEAAVLASGRHAELVVDTALVDGKPTTAMRAQAPHAAMIVLGSRGLFSATELLTTGGIAVPVTAHASCPVVVVREHATADPRTVVVGVDGSRRSEPAVAYAFDEAVRRDATVVAVQVRQPGSGLMASLSMPEEIKEGRIRPAETLAGWTEKYPNVPTIPGPTGVYCLRHSTAPVLFVPAPEA